MIAGERKTWLCRGPATSCPYSELSQCVLELHSAAPRPPCSVAFGDRYFSTGKTAASGKTTGNFWGQLGIIRLLAPGIISSSQAMSYWLNSIKWPFSKMKTTPGSAHLLKTQWKPLKSSMHELLLNVSSYFCLVPGVLFFWCLYTLYYMPPRQTIVAHIERDSRV